MSPMNIMKLTYITLITVLLSGCFENRNNTSQLCDDNPNLRCERLNINDGQCRITRTDLIWQRYSVLKDASVDNLIKEYHTLAAYQKCLNLASQIRAIDQTKLKEKRFIALRNSTEDEEILVERIRQLKDPEALYFLWSQTGDKKAQRQFLQMEGSAKLNTPKMQYALATFYTSRDPEKTIQLLNHALELYTDDDDLNLDIIKSLASNYQLLDRKPQAYIWAIVAKQYGVNIASAQELQLLYGFTKQQYKTYDEITNKIIVALKEGNYKANLVPDLLK
ncbi:hypothetical protein VPAL9027_00748 [Vibrio palustris]|uniref:DUF2989 domain-containing protein n=2 Tax=Vibrio palustris TaxID=1918946 RepID=A0A1R4B1L4_9VIBR|nr:hypothetical protein VPAL9027_00748 [Vibrio palustris]